ncbi:hypothetical protein KZY75_04125 [Prevotella salivae]|uniref:Uncharacterized protein n=1 Tax=Segatella salivae TaxID=228604 RepID=A0AAW4NSL1_9BACT|nr:hypothetical protein [Segatella salivae]MBW4866690.1 hypothetical protein [Segatella salivae]MBW4907891.1 hypothetical protein [Segatella salivae]MBW4909231.1 hypothetical protein [Segatella salivae]
MINSFVLSAIKESYYLNNNMKEISFKEYLENEAENEPNFFYELFENEDYEQNWDSVLSEEDREEWNNLLNKANDIWSKMLNDEEEEQRARVKSHIEDLFDGKDIEGFRELIQNLNSYDNFSKQFSGVIDMNYIDEEEYKEIVKEAITEYIENNDIEVNIKVLNNADVVEDGDNSFTYKGEEYQGFDSSDGGDFNCTSCENFDLINEAVQETNCDDKEDLTMYLCGMNFVYKNMVDDVMCNFYFK